jgi:hypothetical protein
MSNIRNIVNGSNASLEDLIYCFDIIRQNGDVAIIKFDGERVSNPYTVFITFHTTKNRAMIRVDGSDLKVSLVEVLSKYDIDPDV